VGHKGPAGGPSVSRISSVSASSAFGRGPAIGGRGTEDSGWLCTLAGPSVALTPIAFIFGAIIMIGIILYIVLQLIVAALTTTVPTAAHKDHPVA
jgi:hypothetical protein